MRMLRGSLRQVSSRGEQWGSVLLAHKGVGRSQPADSEQQSCTTVLILSSTLAPASPQRFRTGAVSWRAQADHGTHVQCGMSGFCGVGWFGRAPYLAVCMAEGEIEQCPQQATLVAGLGSIIFHLQAGPWRPALTVCRAVVLGLPWLAWKAG